MPIVDADGNEIVHTKMPDWHKDIQPESLVNWCGHFFEFLGIDPEHDVNVVVMKYKEPSKSTIRRNNARSSKNDASE